MLERALNRVAPLSVAGRWNHFEQQIHCRVLQCARRISLSIAYDHSARRIRRLGGDARQL